MKASCLHADDALSYADFCFTCLGMLLYVLLLLCCEYEVFDNQEIFLL